MYGYDRKTTTLGILAAAAAAFPLLIGITPASAELYYYKDAQGVFHFTEEKVPGAVPFDSTRQRKHAARPKSAGIRTARVSPPRTPAHRPAVRRAPSTAGAPVHYDELIHRTASRYGVEPELVKAVVRAESNFNRHAVSHRGARGLMQLMPRTAHSYGVRNLHDPEQNIQGGVRHLRRLLDRFQNVRLAVAAYNAGAGAVRRFRGVPPYRETLRYVDKVLRYRAEYLRRGAGIVLAAHQVNAG